MDISAFQLFKNNSRTNANNFLHDTPIVSFGRVVKVIDAQTVVAEAVVQASLSREAYAVTLLDFSSALAETSVYPKLGDTVLLLFLQRHDPRMFIMETISNPNAAGYNRFSGVGVLMSSAKSMAKTVLSFCENGSIPIASLKSSAEWHAAFHDAAEIAFCRAAINSGDERLVAMLFGQGRPLIQEFHSRVERKYGFWRNNDRELVELDASVKEAYSVHAPIERSVQGSQTANVGLGEDKDGNPVETDAPIAQIIHGKAPVALDIRSPQDISIGIGNCETGESGEQRDAPVTICLGEKADICVDSGSGKAEKYAKPIQMESGDAIRITAGEKITVENASESLGAVLSDFIQAVHDAITLGSSTAQAMNPDTKDALQALKRRCEALLEK